MQEISAAMDRLTAAYAAPPWSEEIARAREEYDALRGNVREDDAIFEVHLASFLEWYLLERPLSGGEAPVLTELRAERGEPEERKCLRALALSHRSVFEVVDVLKRELLLSDLVGGGLWRVEQDPPLEGVDPGDIFEARLVPWEGRVRFGSVFCFHPRPAREPIHALLRRAEADGRLDESLVPALAGMRLRYDRFCKTPVERVYSFSWRSPEPI
jgi:hypothetical protein